MNITLRDLLRWRDSALYTTPALPPQGGEPALLRPDRAVSWPVTMRAASPMLPHVDDGAIVLLPAATLAEVRRDLPGVLHELRRRDVAALVLDPDETLGIVPDDLDVLRARGGVIHNLELLLTRLLNERRARLYRRGTALDRALTEATLRGQGTAGLLRIGAAQGGRTLLLLDERGRLKEAHGPDGPLAPEAAPRPPAPPLGVDSPLAPVQDPAHGAEWLLCPLSAGPADGRGGVAGWLALCGPQEELDEVDRLLATRVAAACAMTLGRRTTPPLPPARRAALVADLLRADLPAADRAAHSETLGLDATATAAYAVLTLGAREGGGRDGGEGEGGRALYSLRRALGARLAVHAETHDFEGESPRAVGLLLRAAGGEGLARAGAAARAALAAAPAAGAVAAALSAPVADLDGLPAAARQAGFALALLRAGAVPGPLASWDVVDDLGPYRLLYPLWGTPEAARFVAATLGALPDYDARYGGELLATLLAYLQHGGAAGSAAAQLAIHRNTLTYRLRRIEEVSGRSPLDPAQQLSLHLAALLHRLPPPPEE